MVELWRKSSVPLVRNVPPDLLFGAQPARAMALLDDTRRLHGDLFQIECDGWQAEEGRHRWLLLTRAHHVRALSLSDPEHLSASAANRVLFGAMLPRQGTFALEGEAHRSHRRLLVRSLGGHRLADHVATMTAQVGEVVDRWELHSHRPFDLLREIQRITIGTILRAVLGLEAGARLDHLAERLRLLEDAEVTATERMEVARELQGVIADELRVRSRGAQPRGDLFSQLLAAGEGDTSWTDEAIEDEIFTVLHAGFGSTSTMIAWCFEALLAHPRVLVRVERELDEVLGDRPLCTNNLAYLATLDAAILEAFRLRPLFLVAGARRVERPWVIDGYAIEPGTIVAICTYLLHRHPGEWRDPEVYRPERFLRRRDDGRIDGVVRPDPYRWSAFGGGGRRCPGMAFALTEARVVVAEVLRRVRLSPVADTAPEGSSHSPVRRGFFLAPKGGPAVVARRR